MEGWRKRDGEGTYILPMTKSSLEILTGIWKSDNFIGNNNNPGYSPPTPDANIQYASIMNINKDVRNFV